MQSALGDAAVVDLSAGWEELAAVRSAGQQAGWLLQPDEFEIQSKIGMGSSGTVYQGVCRGAEVAIKKAHLRNARDAASFIQEVKVLSRLRSPHIVPFLGACLEPPDHCMLLTELQHGGTLRDWLYDSRKPQPLAKRLQVAIEIARGMQCIQESTPTTLHRDLKPTNILMGQDDHVKIADFSLARYMPAHSEPLTGETGTYFYMAPEVIRHEPYSGAADVYSFAVLLCELLTMVVPYSDKFLTPIQVAYSVADQGVQLRPTLPNNCDPALLALITMGWHDDPLKRPSFAVFAKQLDTIVHALLTSKPPSRPGSALGKFFGLE
ncbi:hypothetical protein CYMTET_26697 [Cymbomonas tetramitiformis]|uniref:Protein kinase domain-containing protein n=1 Tax=Cymbomonas tetramitiformis TaxID=36881 RepID=A0AAE0FRK0_9CHLO|nr:hypothetical protein CYMTET_26697 [Cymbomonas tetramitiformis]